MSKSINDKKAEVYDLIASIESLQKQIHIRQQKIAELNREILKMKTEGAAKPETKS